jgi:hypothetical protein
MCPLHFVPNASYNTAKSSTGDAQIVVGSKKIYSTNKIYTCSDFNEQKLLVQTHVWLIAKVSLETLRPVFCPMELMTLQKVLPIP